MSIMKPACVGGFCLGGTARFCILGSGKGRQFRQFLCDAQGNRVLKEKTAAVGTVSKRTWSVRSDAGRTITWTPYGKMEAVLMTTVDS